MQSVNGGVQRRGVPSGSLLEPSRAENPDVETAETKDFRLGVLLVHGIGKQALADSLVRWGDALLKVIGQATNNRIEASVDRARTDTERAEAILTLRSADATEKWLLAECWWAQSFPSPTYRELVSWSVRALPWCLALHVAGTFWSGAERSAGRFLVAVSAVAQLLLVLPIALLSTSFLVIALPLGLLPIPSLRQFILSVQSTLTATVGDSLVFTESPMRAAFIRTRVADELERLVSRCDETLVLAHSQGAAVTLDALGGLADSVDREPRWPQRPVPTPSALLTFGAGINQLIGLKLLRRTVQKTVGFNPATFALGAEVAAAAMLVWVVSDLVTQELVLVDLMKVALAFVVWITVMQFLNHRIGAWPEESGLIEVALFVFKVILLASAAIVVSAVYLFFSLGTAVAPTMLLLSLSLLALAVYEILWGNLQAIAKRAVRRPPGLDLWIDVYAAKDPVPNGPTRSADGKTVKAIEIWNRGSRFSDHVSYWQNTDGFVLRVARLCSEVAKSSWAIELPAETSAIDRRAAWRVWFLQLTRRAITVWWVSATSLLWYLHGEQVPDPRLPNWQWTADLLPDMASRFTLLCTLTGGIAVLGLVLVAWLWDRWRRAEQHLVLVHQQVRSRAVGRLVPLAAVFWTLVLLPLGPAVWSSLAGLEIGIIMAALFNLSLILAGAAVVSAILLARLKPPPEWEPAAPI